MDAANLPGLPERPAPAGELVVQNGRLSGARRALGNPLTLLGQASGCQIRLNADGISPLHCAIVAGPDGLFLRDLETESGTRVNGRPVDSARLQDGDRLDIGPFQFTVSLGAPPTSEAPLADRALLEHEREALSVQVGAVAAQQAALTEEEARLQQRSAALQRQEEQLAAHLQERQQRLDEQQEQLEQERAAFKEASARESAERDARRAEVEQLQTDARAIHQEADQRRKRVAELHYNLVKRHRKHWQAEEAKIKRRESEATRASEQAKRERTAVRAFQERTNGDLELGRRRLAAERQELNTARRQWEERIGTERTEQQRREDDLAQLAAEVAQSEAELKQYLLGWEKKKATLEREVAGLEERIRNHRGRLSALKPETAKDPVACEPIIPPAPEPMAPQQRDKQSRLRELVGRLSDQRGQLGEQWRKILDLQESWQQERARALAELEAAAEQLQEREQELVGREASLGQLRLGLERECSRAAAVRGSLNGWQTQLAMQQAASQAERGKALADRSVWERETHELRTQLEAVAAAREKRWQSLLADWGTGRDRCEAESRACVGLRRECEELRGKLAKQERTLASKALSLERYRQELVQRASDSARAEARLARLERREGARLEQAGRELETRRQSLLDEASKVERLREEVSRRETELVQQRWGTEQRIAEWEEGQLAAAAEPLRLEADLQREKAQHALDERQLRQLRDELERLARSMLEDEEVETQAA